MDRYIHETEKFYHRLFLEIQQKILETEIDDQEIKLLARQITNDIKTLAHSLQLPKVNFFMLLQITASAQVTGKQFKETVIKRIKRIGLNNGEVELANTVISIFCRLRKLSLGEITFYKQSGLKLGSTIKSISQVIQNCLTTIEAMEKPEKKKAYSNRMFPPIRILRTTPPAVSFCPNVSVK